MQNNYVHKTPAGPVKIGDILRDLLQNTVEPKVGQYQTISLLWEKNAPENLRRHCRVCGTENGVVSVQADSSSIVFELRLDSQRYLSQIQKACPSMRIKKLKFIVGQ